MTITEKAFGAENPTFGLLLNQLGTLYRARGNFRDSKSLLLRAAEILEKNRGDHSPELAQLYSNLGMIYSHDGDYLEAGRRLRLALGLKEETVGPDHLDLTPILANLAVLHWLMGDAPSAEGYFRRSLGILEKAFGPNHVNVGVALAQLGTLYAWEDEPDKAEPTLLRAIEILEKERPEGHGDVGFALVALAKLYSDREDYEKAERQLLRAKAILEYPGQGGVGIIPVLVGLGNVHFVRGEYAEAESKLNSALAVCERELGPNHPGVVTILHNLAIVSEAQNRPARAVELITRADDVSERHLARNIGAGSERQKLLYVSSLSDELDHTITLHVRFAPKDRQALRLALTTLLMRKGRTLDVMTDIIRTLRRDEEQDDELRGALDALADARSRYAARIHEGAGDTPPEKYRAEVEDLAARVEKLEARVGTRDPQFRARPVTLEEIKDALPRDAALVEFSAYNPFDPKTGEWQSPRYVAYILKGTGELDFADLGDADGIDEQVVNFRKSLRGAEAGYRKHARVLDELVMRPVRERLGKVDKLFISPDSGLNLFPFAALVDENGRHLLENYFITYVTSGRDLLRLKNPLPSRQGPLVITNPNFDADVNVAGPDAKAGGGAGGRRRSKEFQDHFSSLAGFAAEGTEVGKLLPDAVVLSEAQATEAAVKKVRGPRVLHLNTHGFFLPKQKQKVKGLRGMT